jgi:hypothetical protein
LSEIARVGRGQYYRASADGSELAALTVELDRLQAAQLDSRFETTKIERFQIFLLGAVLALMAAELIPGRVREKTARAWVLKVRGLAARKA